jgi:hypothetical protein
MWMERYSCKFDYRSEEGKVDNTNHSGDVGT